MIPGDRARAREDEERSAGAARRAEVVEILAGALFTLVLEGRVRRLPDVAGCNSESAGEVTSSVAPAAQGVPPTTSRIVGELPRAQRRHTKPYSIEPPVRPTRRPARVAVMLAIAHKIQRAIDGGQVPDRAEMTRRLGFTRARLTQLLDLTLLAPDVQEQVLFLEAVDGVEPLSERVLRKISHAAWAQQRRTWVEVAAKNLSPIGRDADR